MSERTHLQSFVVSLVVLLVVSLLAAAAAALAHDEHAPSSDAAQHEHAPHFDAAQHEHAPHFDAAQHGGVVLEFHDEIHYELVAPPGGKLLQIWLTDAHRRPLAASEVADLVAEIGHPGNQVEQVDMHISDDGGSWVGAVHLQDPSDVVRIGFTYHQMTATGSLKYNVLLHPPMPPATVPHDHGHDHGP